MENIVDETAIRIAALQICQRDSFGMGLILPLVTIAAQNCRRKDQVGGNGMLLWLPVSETPCRTVQMFSALFPPLHNDFAEVPLWTIFLPCVDSWPGRASL